MEVWQAKKSCTRKELESFVGHLAYAAMVICPGRIFLRSLFSLLSTTAKPHFHIRVNTSVRADLQWWLCFLQLWNGLSFFPLPSPSRHIYSDASGSFGCGAFDPATGWFQLQWPALWSLIDIAAKEMVPVVVAAALWGRLWEGCHICFHSDNMAVVAVLNKRTAKDPFTGKTMQKFLIQKISSVHLVFKSLQTRIYKLEYQPCTRGNQTFSRMNNFQV